MSSEIKIDVPADSVVVTATAPVNIAVIKYWGKRDGRLILPVNSSLSGTIEPGTMQSRTTIIASKSFKQDSMSLNGKEEDIRKNQRLLNVLREMRARAGDYKDEKGRVLISASDWSQYGLKIISNNNFPTAAGLASSASGFACMTKCLAGLYGFQERFDGELTIIARQGSGSACRSLHGGFVKWEMGTAADGSDSKAVQIVDEKYWPQMRVLILVASSGPKEISSTSGMEETVLTSPLMKHRAEAVVPARMREMEQAIKQRDFTTFAHLTMQDSNQFHAVCLDTYPPIFYLNDTSKKIINMVHAINSKDNKVKVAYTFDAGPNAVLYLLDEHLPMVFATLLKYFKPQEESLSTYVTDPMNIITSPNSTFESLTTQADASVMGHADPRYRVYRMIVSKLGTGAQIVESRHSFPSSTL